jgi:hypothetical protein
VQSVTTAGEGTTAREGGSHKGSGCTERLHALVRLLRAHVQFCVKLHAAHSGSKQREHHSSPLVALTARAKLGFSAVAGVDGIRSAAEPEGDAIIAAENPAGLTGAVCHRIQSCARGKAQQVGGECAAAAA